MKDAAANFDHAVAVRGDGTVACWGRNGRGQCSPPPHATNIVSAAAGFEHTAALRADGTVVCWGDNSSGQCDVPPDLTDAAAVAAGGSHTAALRADGTVACWGYSAAVQVPPDLAPASLIGAGGGHTLACTGTGEVTAWGWNDSGQSESRSFTDGAVRYLGGGLHFSLALVGGPRTFTDPLDADTDGDGMPDGWEVAHGFDPRAAQADGTHGAADDPDEDGLANRLEGQHGSDPFRKDTDGDGLEDGPEVNVHGTDPVLRDTDNDGMADGWEVRYDFNPRAVQTDGIHGALDDPDGDGLFNRQESRHGTDPFNPDTDGDTLTDGWEARHGFDPHQAQNDGTHGVADDPDGDGLTNLQEHQHGTDPFKEDTDGDGLADPQEIALKADWPCLSPLAWDSDGDMLPDGWEMQYGLSPCGCAATNSPAWDADGDGLGLFDEYRYCTDPTNPDTDGDGVRDGDEVPHSPGSCPNDPDDEGDPANCVTLRLTVGDPSGSESERWNFEVFEEATGRDVVRHCDDGFGTPGSAEYALVKGKAYTFSLRWVATNLDEGPDYDWRAKINDSTAAGAYEGLYGTGPFIVEDPDDLLTDETHGNAANITLGKQGRIIVPKIVTETVATSPPDRARKTIGVGEEVVLRVLPEGIAVSLWAITQGGGDLSYYSGSTTTYTAPDENNSATVAATISGIECEVGFEVLEPSEVFFENKDYFLANYNPNGYVNSSNFVLSYLANVYLKPDTVNFYKLQVYEGAADVDPQTPGWGAFLDEIRANPHQANGPHAMTGSVIAGKGTLLAFPDQIRGYTPDGPFEPIVAEWNIQWSYGLNSTVKSIETIVQKFTVSVPTNPPSMDARFTIEKKASGITIGTGDLDAQWIGNQPQ